MSQPCVLPQLGSNLATQIQQENAELRKRLLAQQKILTSLENRVTRSLGVLQINLDRLNQSPTESGWQGSLNLLEIEVNRLRDLLSDAMLLQKLEAGKFELNLELLDLAPILTLVSRHLLEPKDGLGKLICKIDSPLPLVLADQELVEAVLMDLLVRGLKYSNELPVIFEAEHDPHNVYLKVSAQRFAPIGDRDSAPEIALCCRRIEVQGGEVTCQIRADGLSTVTVRLKSV